MECREIEKRMDRYDGGELEPEQIQQISNHMKACATCRRSLDDYRAMSQRFHTIGQIKAPDTFTMDVMHKINDLTVTKIYEKPTHRMWGASLIAAGLLMVFLNVSGLSKEIKFEKVWDETASLQRNILLSTDETSKTITRILNGIEIKIRR
ncbi:MAG: anti-sigma factor family protein [Bacillota bacterium]